MNDEERRVKALEAASRILEATTMANSPLPELVAVRMAQRFEQYLKEGK